MIQVLLCAQMIMPESDFNTKLACLKQVQDRYHPDNYRPGYLAEKIQYDPDFTMTYSHESVVEVVQCDTLEAARKLHDPLVLILADDVRPGGNFLALVGMHEESLFLRSALWRHLTPNLYPIASLEAIYTKAVPILDNNPRDISFVACPGVKMPILNKGSFLPEDRNVLVRKIELLLQIAQTKSHDNLVLGALGCGAWGCPPKEVAAIFMEVLEKHKNAYRKIIFAILGANFNFFEDALVSMKSRIVT